MSTRPLKKKRVIPDSYNRGLLILYINVFMYLLTIEVSFIIIPIGYHDV